MDSKLNLDILPPEVVVQYLLRLSLEDLANYCLTSKTANAYCQNDAFWKDKYRYDFGLPLPKNPTEKWINLYTERVAFKNSPISVGSLHYAAIDDRGALYVGGNNMMGQLGNGTRVNSEIPIAIKSFNQKIISVSCGNLFTMAITEDGKTYSWGFNKSLLGGVVLVPTLVPVPMNLKAAKVSCSGSGWGIVLDDGSVYVSISIFSGRKYIDTPNRIVLEDKIIDISVHSSSFAVVTKSGKLYLAGKNFGEYPSAKKEFIGIEIAGNMRIIKPEYIPFPPQQGIIPKIKQVSLTNTHIMALTVDSKVFIWGINQFVGSSSRGPRIDLSPQLLTSLPKISYISTYGDISAAITTDGRLYVWGRYTIWNDILNYIPDDKKIGGDVEILTVTEIDIGSRVNYIALGNTFTIAVTVDGMVNYIRGHSRLSRTIKPIYI